MIKIFDRINGIHDPQICFSLIVSSWDYLATTISFNSHLSNRDACIGNCNAFAHCHLPLRRNSTYSTFTKCKMVFSPPYALKTFLCLRLSLGLSAGLVGLIPLSLIPVIGHLGTDGRFLRYWNTSFPPGVLVILRRFDRVLYDNRRRYVMRWTIWKNVSNKKLNLCFICSQFSQNSEPRFSWQVAHSVAKLNLNRRQYINLKLYVPLTWYLRN